MVESEQKKEKAKAFAKLYGKMTFGEKATLVGKKPIDWSKVEDLPDAPYEPAGDLEMTAKQVDELTTQFAEKVAKEWMAEQDEKTLKAPDHPADKSLGYQSKKGSQGMDFSAVTKTQTKTGKRLHLKDATRLYAPIQGTDESSRYVLVAATEDTRVAARWKGGSLSIRLETTIPGISQTLQMNGFSQKKQGHWSLHVSSESALMIWRSLGSILFGLGLEWKTSPPKRDRLEGVGT